MEDNFRKNEDKKSLAITCVVACFIIAAIVFFSANTDDNDIKTASQNADASQTAEQTAAGETGEASEVKNTESASENSENKPASDAAVNESKADSSADEKVYTPTFMYFISSSDENADETLKMLDEFKKKYDGKVNFDIRNIDEDKESAKNFPVEGQTPALIMLNTKNDICAFEFKCSDKSKLEADIENALNAK